MPKAPAPTLLEVLGVERKELVASNLMAFFLNPAGEHGLGTLVLKALLDEEGDGLTSLDSDMDGFEVRTEVLTQEGTRIDIRVEGPDFVCCVENKLYASLYNDLESYREHAHQRADDAKKTILLVLCLSPPDPDLPLFDFNVVTYAKLFGRVESLLDTRRVKSDSDYVSLLLDFIRTLRRSESTAMAVNSDFLTLAKNQEEGLDQLLAHVKQLKDDARDKVDAVREAIEAQLADADETVPTYLGHWSGPLHDSILYEIPHSNGGKLVLGVRLRPSGWSIRIMAKNTTPEAVLKDLRSRGLGVEPIPEEQDRLRLTGFDFEWADSDAEVGAAAAERILQIRA